MDGRYGMVGDGSWLLFSVRQAWCASALHVVKSWESVKFRVCSLYQTTDFRKVEKSLSVALLVLYGLFLFSFKQYGLLQDKISVYRVSECVLRYENASMVNVYKLFHDIPKFSPPNVWTLRRFWCKWYFFSFSCLF